MQQPLRDNKNKIVGYTEEKEGGKKLFVYNDKRIKIGYIDYSMQQPVARDKMNRKLATFDGKATRDSMNRIIGKGDLLLNVIFDNA